jgi:hypothetical protein
LEIAMNFRGLAGLALAVLVAMPSEAQTPAAPPPADEVTLLAGIWPTEGSCTAENTKDVAFEDLLRNGQAYAKGCVSTTAWFGGRALFLRSEDAAADGAIWKEDFAQGRVGVYGDEKTMTRIQASNFKRVRVVGMMWDCDQFHGPRTYMAMGYCHYIAAGPFIGLSSVEEAR